MAYVDETQAGHLITTVTYGGSSIFGVLSATLNIQVDRDVRKDGGNIFPTSRPASFIDAIATVTFLDPSSYFPYTTASGSLIFTLSDGAGNSYTVTITKMLAGSTEFSFQPSSGGMPVTQTFEMENTSLGLTVSI